MLKETNIERIKLQQTLQQNLVDHVQIYDLALKSWQDEYQKYVKDFAKKVKDGDFKITYRPPVKPISYAKNYEDVIAQLNMSADEIITLNATEFQNYILDEWNFSRAFYTSFTSVNSFMDDNGQYIAGLSVSNQAKLAKYLED